ncbi:MAG: transposase [Bacteroidales bacterium]|jgi:putative transposase|nr:transposase [Bacteroidales bacterium]
MKKRKFTQEQKLAILKEASENGVNETLAKHGIFPTTYYQWKDKFTAMGVEGLKHGMTPKQLKRIRALEKENRLLKEIIVEKELEGKLKDELLKKKYALEKRKNS